MPKIAVIGAGVFGSVLSSSLSAKFSVDLFESKSTILSGATPNSVLRLHLGHHYPRDSETALQSVSGFSSFKNAFPEAIDADFQNYYALSKSGSKVSVEQFRSFVEYCGLPTREVGSEKLKEFGVATHKLSASFTAPEGVINPDLLRELLMRDLRVNNVELRVGTEILAARRIQGRWRLYGALGEEFGPYDRVFRTTYASDRIEIRGVPPVKREMEFHRTLVIEIASSFPRFGLTVIDGDFLTVLPVAHGEGHLIYGPSPSVLERFVGPAIPEAWREKGLGKEHDDAAEKILDRLHEWLPHADAQIVALRATVRAITPNLGHSDRRLSEAHETQPGLYDVVSGKIDHSVELANSLVHKLTKSMGK